MTYSKKVWIQLLTSLRNREKQMNWSDSLSMLLLFIGNTSVFNHDSMHWNGKRVIIQLYSIIVTLMMGRNRGEKFVWGVFQRILYVKIFTSWLNNSLKLKETVGPSTGSVKFLRLQLLRILGNSFIGFFHAGFSGWGYQRNINSRLNRADLKDQSAKASVDTIRRFLNEGWKKRPAFERGL